MKKIPVGLIGLGYWGKNLLRNLHGLGVLRVACDTSPSVLADRRKEFPDVEFADSPDKVFMSKEIAAVAIATPASTHFDLVRKGLEAGKDVFVEKPLALNVLQGEELVALAEKRQKIIMVGHVLRYHPAVKKLKSIVADGELGRLQYIYSNRLNIGKLRTEENILWSFAPHDISVILAILGEEPMKVSAFGGAYLNKGVSDTTMTTLEFKNGVKGHIFVSWLHPFKEQKLVVVGSEGMAVFDDVSKEKLFLYPHKIEWRDGITPVAQKADYIIVPTEQGEPLKLELEHFIECVEKRETPLTDGNEGLKVLRILESADKSISRNHPS